MESGWLLRDGEVLASTLHPTGWRGRVLSSRGFREGVGAIVVTGPAFTLGLSVARLGDASRLRVLSPARAVHLIGPGRHAVLVRPEIASKLRAGDELELRLAS